MSHSPLNRPNVSADAKAAFAPSKRLGKSAKSKVNAKPYSIRFTDEERAILNRECGSRAWSGYIRKKLFDGQISTGRTRPLKKPRLTTEDHKVLGQVLAALGQSRLSQNLNQIAKAANMGALPVSPELESELHQACADIQYMRSELVSALGLRQGSKP